MTLRRIVVGAGLLLVGLPLLLILVTVAAFYAFFHFPVRGGAVAGTLVSSGQERQYVLYVPKSYDPSRPAPLVISLHPAMSWPASQMAISGWNAVADEQGAIVVYPAGTGAGPRVWLMEGRRTPSRMPDVVFVSDLIATLERSYRIDPARVYADGLSNGGGMAFVLSCTLPDRIAAVGMVAAARSLDWSWCGSHRPVPSIAFHGTADPVVPYGGGPTPVGPDVFPSVTGFTAEWARHNGCGPGPVESAAAPGIARLEYTGCADDASVVLYTLQGGGHQWPGGRRLPQLLVGPYTRSIDATRLTWDFFRRHPLPGGAGATGSAPPPGS